MTEIIKKIEEFEKDREYEPYHHAEAGFEIETNEQIIVLAIDNESSCCEYWGYFLTEDDIDKFIGRELRGVKITDTNRSTKQFFNYDKSWGEESEYDYSNEDHIGLDEGEVLFVDIETDIGPLQFVAYNAHNGYYGHTARVESKQLTAGKVL